MEKLETGNCKLHGFGFLNAFQDGIIDFPVTDHTLMIQYT
jgi:hypothetical protein